MRRWLLPILIAFATSGCFVFDELEKGQEIMDAHSPNRQAEEAEAPAPEPRARRGAKDEGVVAGLLASAKGWWQDTTEPKPMERDPDDVPVSCELGGSTQFMRKSDCLVRGGRVR